MAYWWAAQGGTMKTDLYTRIVLTVIAVCLVWLCVNSLTPSAAAQADTQKVVVVGWNSNPLPVIIADAKGAPLMGPNGLHVSIGEQVVPITIANQAQPLPVTIRAIERAGPWQPISVDVLKTPPTVYPAQ
jgi:hypothetical protein